jgi:hypothetical protein
MKTRFLSLLLAAIVCLTAVTTSCIYDPQSGEVVVTEKICVNKTQYETDGSISSRAVYDEFRERLIDRIHSYGATLEDIEDISVVSATCKLVKNSGDHDWTLTYDVYVKRADVADGPAMLVSAENASLDGFQGKPTEANLHGDGVALIDRALDDLLEGADPQVWVEMQNESIVPEPTESDPLDFRWLVCVEFQAVVYVGD